MDEKGRTERLAVDELALIVDKSHCISSDFRSGDKGISFDGHICTALNGGKTPTERYSPSVLVQIKGKKISKTNKTGKPKVPSSFSWGKSHLINALREGGAILFVVNFLPDGRKEIRYADLLPVNIQKLISRTAARQISVPLKPIPFKSATARIERICKKFLKDREVQTKIGNVETSIVSADTNSKNTMRIEAGIITNEEIERRLTYPDFYYIEGEKGDSQMKVLYERLNEVIVHSANVVFSTIDKKICFTSSELHINDDGSSRQIVFGDAFTLDEKTLQIRVKITGTLSQRITQLEFTKSIIENHGFLLGGEKIEVEFKYKTLGIVDRQLSWLKKLSDNLKKLRVRKDPNLDLWTEKDYGFADSYFEQIINGGLLPKLVETPTLGGIRIGDIKLSFALILEGNNNKAIDIMSLDKNLEKHRFSCSNHITGNTTKPRKPLTRPSNTTRTTTRLITIAAASSSTKGDTKTPSPISRRPRN